MPQKQQQPNRYTAVKHTQSGVQLKRIVSREGGEDVLTLESKMHPAGSFDGALQKLEGALRQWCEFDPEYAEEGLTVQAVYFKPKDDSLQLTGYVELKHGGLAVPSPVQHPEGAEGPGPGFYNGTVMGLVEDVWREADAYWEGKRQQGELFE